MVEPIFAAQVESVRRSRVIARDETSIKAGRAGPGKMKAAYFWPVVSEQDEICFLYQPSRIELTTNLTNNYWYRKVQVNPVPSSPIH
ncbi:transposase [Massilia sp. DJPM01]|uniref:IS66 family transposase n=1 Tax=Massilia sp. DJPM01 TaxID=3024404 RepID=UPI0035A31EA1